MSGAENSGAPADAKPFLTVVKGSPSDEEIAALTVVLAAAAAAASTGGTPDPGPTNRWGLPTANHRPNWGMPTSYIHRG